MKRAKGPVMGEPASPPKTGCNIAEDGGLTLVTVQVCSHPDGVNVDHIPCPFSLTSLARVCIISIVELIRYPFPLFHCMASYFNLSVVPTTLNVSFHLKIINTK